jgi:D-alanine-D-alanine ligase
VSDPATVGVIFGGPGPEHDVSVLTGLQAERCLNQGGIPATGLYWGKGGDFHDVGAGREAASFRDGVPAGAQPLVDGLGPGCPPSPGWTWPRPPGRPCRRSAAR